MEVQSIICKLVVLHTFSQTSPLYHHKPLSWPSILLYICSNRTPCYVHVCQDMTKKIGN